MAPLGAASAPPIRRTVADPPPPPPVETGGGVFSLLGDETFNPASPVLKDGTVLTGDALAVYEGINWLLQNHADRYVEDGGSNLNALATRDNLYYYARTLGTIYGDLFVLFRITGDLRVLDELCRIAALQATKLAVGWRGHDPSKVNWPRHNYRCWVSGSNVGDLYNGTDYHPLDSPRTHEPLFQLLYALRVNQHLDSPANGAGYYEAQADFWEDYLRDYVRIWRGVEQAPGRDRNGNVASGWSANYRGQLHDYYYDLYGSRRASDGVWPMISRHHMHSHVGATALHYWMGKALGPSNPDFADAVDVAIHAIEELVFQRNLYEVDTRYGKGLVWPRSLHDTGHGTAASPLGNYAEGSMYLGYTIHNLVNMWLDGAIPDFATVMAPGAVRTWNEYLFRGLTSSQGLHISALQDHSFTGSNALKRLTDSQRLAFDTSVGKSGTSISPRSNFNLVSSSVNLLMAWDTDDDHFETHVWGTRSGGDFGRMGAHSVLTGSGGTPISRPKVLSPSIGLLMKLVGADQWDPSDTPGLLM